MAALSTYLTQLVVITVLFVSVREIVADGGLVVILSGGAVLVDGQVIPSNRIEELSFQGDTVTLRDCKILPKQVYQGSSALSNDTMIFGGGYVAPIITTVNDDDHSLPVIRLKYSNQTYRWSNGKWKVWNQFDFIQGQVRFVNVKDKLYALGSCGIATCLEVFEKSWKRIVQPMYFSSPGVTTDANNIYAVGGSKTLAANRVRSLRVARYFSVSEQKWNPLPQMNVPRDSPAVVLTNNYLCAAGGLLDYSLSSSRTVYAAMRSVECLDLKNADDGWHIMPLLPEPRMGSSMIASHGTLYLMGGVNVPIRWLSNKNEDDDIMATLLDVEMTPSVLKLKPFLDFAWQNLTVNNFGNMSPSILPRATAIIVPEQNFGPCL